MRFTLYYDGPLPSAAKNARTGPKHEIRKAIHPQLLELFRRNRNLPRTEDGRDWANWDKWIWPALGYRAWEEDMAVFPKGRLRFVPLVRRNLHLHCELDVLFLRYGEPGSIIESGDVDNRLLTLSDGLRLSRDQKEIDYVNSQNDFPENDPVFCLLEDDSLISRWNIKTDALLETPNQKERVRLIIEVTVKASQVTADNLRLIGD